MLARHDKALAATDFTKYANDPAGFMRDVLRCEPWSMQVTMAEAVRDHPRVVVVTANGIGKDWCTARLALWFCFARRGFVILTGPTQRQVKEILMRQVRVAFAAAPELPGELFQMELRVSDDCGILAFTSDNADKLTGYHNENLLICVTEGQGVEDEAYEAARACCTSPKNRLFVYGNPTRPTGPFVKAAESDHWHTLTVPASAHPNVISGREEIPGAISREWVDAMRDEYGEGSSVFQSRVMARFPTESLEGLIKREWLRAAFDRWESGELIDVTAKRYLSLDVARFGPDSSVLSIVRGPVVEELVTWRGLALTESADRTLRERDRVWTNRMGPPPAILVDEPGVGGGCIDILRKLGARVIPYNGANTPKDERRFLNSRAETHWTFRTLLENGRIALPRDRLLEEEAMAVEWQINPATNKIQILSKDTMRGTLGRSPDRLDSVIVGLAQSVGNLSRKATWHTLYI